MPRFSVKTRTAEQPRRGKPKRIQNKQRNFSLPISLEFQTRGGVEIRSVKVKCGSCKGIGYLINISCELLKYAITEVEIFSFEWRNDYEKTQKSEFVA